MLKSRRSIQQVQGVLIGLVVTAACIAWFFTGDEPRAELITYDWRMRHFNTLQPDPRIVHVDIDDGAVERVGRWPWRRRQIADLIRTISEAGPKLILVDLLLSEPEEPYYDDPRFSGTADDESSMVGTLSDANIVHGDLELADAIRAAGNVVLSAQLDAVPPSAAPTISERVREWRSLGGKGAVEDAIRDLKLKQDHVTRAEVERIITRLDVVDVLSKDFSATDETIAQKIGRPVADVAAVLAGAKTEAARRLVARRAPEAVEWAAIRPGDLGEVLKNALGDRAGRNNADRRDLVTAYHRLKASLENYRKALRLFNHETNQLHRNRGLTPLIEPLAEAASDIAAVNFRDDGDGTVRRVPILIGEKKFSVYLHLGLSAAKHAMGLDLRRLDGDIDVNAPYPSIDEKQVAKILGGDQKLIELPLDRDGSFLIHWAATAPQWLAGKDMPHITAAKLMTIASAREAIRDNETRANYKLAEVVSAVKGGFTVEGGSASAPTEAYADSAYRHSVNKQIDLELQIRRARLRGDKTRDELSAMQRESDELLAIIRREQDSAVNSVSAAMSDLKEFTEEEIAADPGLKADAERYRASALLVQDVAELRKTNEEIAATIHDTQAELVKHLKGKFVFLGFAATAQGDIVTTAIDPRTNGVMCHAHVLNTILQNRPIHPIPDWVGVLICLAGGGLTSLVTSTIGPRNALMATLGLMGGYGALNCELLFKRFDMWVVLAAPESCIFLSWAFVTLFRQLTAERDKRHFAKQLAQYTSPVLAAKIAESDEAAAAFKSVQTRDITCFFSDLQGFTTLAETQDPELIQHVLNTYLHRMSQVIWDQHGLLNKFMGDGIMAFFNASVDPMVEHPKAAVETALTAMEELERLKIDRASDPAANIFNALAMRIGLAGGLCKNGDLGSDLKADYTVIGDVVNLAARLEPANKVFGTSIMISGPTREFVRDLYEFRYLAELQVKGKNQTVPVYEVVGRKGQLSADQREYIERFEAGIELYKARKWDECIVHFTRLLSRRFDDPGASRYIDACQEMKLFPPDDSWRGALELKEK